MNNRKRMIAKVYRKYPKLMQKNCTLSFERCSEAFLMFGKAAKEMASALAEILRNVDWRKLSASLENLKK